MNEEEKKEILKTLYPLVNQYVERTVDKMYMFEEIEKAVGAKLTQPEMIELRDKYTESGKEVKSEN